MIKLMEFSVGLQAGRFLSLLLEFIELLYQIFRCFRCQEKSLMS